MDLSFLLYYKPPLPHVRVDLQSARIQYSIINGLQSIGFSNAFNALYFLSLSTCTCGRIANPPERKRMFINNLQS